MIRRAVALGLGLLLVALGATATAFRLRAAAPVGQGSASQGSAAEGAADWALLVPLALVVIGVVLVSLAARALLHEGRRRAMPLAVPRAAPSRAGSSSPRWALADVASEVARRLQGSPYSVHHEGERLEVRWAGEGLARHRCELRDGGEGLLVHADVIESPLELRRLHNGLVTWAGPSRHAMRSGTSAAFRSLDRSAVHDALDEALAVAGWSRRG